MTRTGIEPATLRSGVESSTIEPPHRSHDLLGNVYV